MATKNKRKLLENDSDSDTERSDNWAKFIVLQTVDEQEKPITKLSPFVIEKTLKGIIGQAQSIKKNGKMNPCWWNVGRKNNQLFYSQSSNSATELKY